MNSILSFLLFCLALAVLVGIGGVVLNVLLGLAWMLIITIVAGIGWIWQKRTVLITMLSHWKHLP